MCEDTCLISIMRLMTYNVTTITFIRRNISIASVHVCVLNEIVQACSLAVGAGRWTYSCVIATRSGTSVSNAPISSANIISIAKLTK